MPGSATTPGRPGARARAPVRVAFRVAKRVGTRDLDYFAAQWLACMFPCRRFAGILTNAVARLGADADRYSFIVVDFHHLLLASLLAHLQRSGGPRSLAGVRGPPGAQRRASVIGKPF